MRKKAGDRMLGLSKTFFGNRREKLKGAQRKSDSSDENVEAVVLKALHVMAQRSSPHSASTRASMARAISVLEASTLGLSHIEELVDESRSLCLSGLEQEDAGKRELLAERYADIIIELDAVAKGTAHGGVHLIGNERSTLEIDLGDPNMFKLKLPHVNLTSGPQGLALPAPARAFESTASLKQFDRHLALVKDRLAHTTHTFEAHATDLAKRLALILEGAFADGGELADGRTEPARAPAPMERDS